MHKFYTFLLPIIFSTVSAQNNVEVFAEKQVYEEFKYKATYELTWQSDSTNTEFVEREAMILYVGDKISRFSSRDRLEGDKLLKTRQKNPGSFTGNMQGSSKRSLGYYIYKGIPDGKLSYTQKIIQDNYQYVEDLNQFEWKIQPEKKQIFGYQVQKATTRFSGREYIAWFTPEIPIADGPYKFHGLPGLIIEIQDTRAHYSFILKNFEILEETELLDFAINDYILTTKENFSKVINEYNRNPETALEQAGIIIALRPGQKEKIKRDRREELKRINNPIELE